MHYPREAKGKSAYVFSAISAAILQGHSGRTELPLSNVSIHKGKISVIRKALGIRIDPQSKEVIQGRRGL